MKSGATRYFGAVCSRHPELAGERSARSRHCAACNRERVALWQREKRSQYNETRRARYEADPAVRYAQNSRWRRANLGKAASIGARYKARRRAAAVSLTPGEARAIQALYAEAARRTAQTGIRYHVDHDKPLARGGKHHPDNLIVVPASLNLAKGAKYASTMEYLLS